MTDFTKFGFSIDANQIADAVQSTIEEFIKDYLAEAERQRELAPQTIPIFKTYSQVNEFRNWADDETPVCVIVSPGMSGKPLRKGRGEYMGNFTLGVAAIVQANQRENTNKLSRVYGAVLRQLLVQQAGMGGLVTGIDWEDEKYNDVPESEDRSQASAQVLFTVEVPGIVDASKGILAPSEEPYELDPEEPTATDVNVDIEEKAEVGP
jgi:hypothetical protein